ncbi:IS5 family transposase [Paenibacillus polymyxa]|uniref:IS5 family transposase n=1 Tax=Paenibacillus polymyxa TaxID=1406 RepID=UPI00118708F7|nr:IS5 family transposase [Paenibacillus polymyxa]QOH62287.1 IS5 family transposase [Paenibacillus polymyxa]
MRRRYELTDEEWNIVDPLLPARKKQGGRPPKDRRQMLNAVLWVARTGAPWRDLPSYYGPWSSAYSFFWRLQKANIWGEILKHVAIEPDWEQVMVDATIVRVHQHGAGKRGQDRQAIGRSRGGLTTKIHAMVDALGYPLRFELTPGQDHDSVTGYRLLHELDFCPGEVLADRAYDTNAILELLQSRAITPVIPSKRNRRVKRPLDSETYKERHLIECFFNKVKNYRRLATRYEKTANMFMAFLTLLSIRLWLK